MIFQRKVVSEESYHFVSLQSCLQKRKQVAISRKSKGKRLAPDNEHSALSVEALYGEPVMRV